MATIRLTNARTGVAYNYPLAYIDLSDTTGITFTSGDVFGASLNNNCADIDPAWASRPEAEKKIYQVRITSSDTISPERYLTDYITPDSADNLLYQPPTTTIASLFNPVTTEEGVTWSEKPADYDTYLKYYNPTQYILGGVHLTKPGLTWVTSGNDQSLNRKWYESTTANVIYRTSQQTTFAISMGLSAYNTNNRYHVGVVANCRAQWNSAVSPEANAYPGYGTGIADNNGVLSSTTGSVCSLSNSDIKIGDWADYEAVHTTDEQDEEVVPTSRIATQMVYTTIDGADYIGCAVILFEESLLGMKPVSLKVTLYPSWLIGGIDGAFTPPGTVDHVDTIPTPVRQVKNGSWSIVQNQAGVPSIPSSPINIGKTDAGIHLVVMDANALNNIQTAAWNIPSVFALQNFMTGIISCGFFPYEFIKSCVSDQHGMTSCVIGKTGVSIPQTGSAYHMWHGNANVFTRPILSQGQTHFHTFEVPLRGTYGNYLDFEGTTVELDIPFCGKLSLPPSTCIGGKIHVDYNVNLTNGDVCATVTTESDSSGLIVDGMDAISTNGSISSNNKKLYKTYFLNGNCMCPFQIIGTTTGEMQKMQATMQIVSGLATAGTSAFSGNIAGTVYGLGQTINATMDKFNANYQPYSGGSPIGSAALIGNKRIVLTISIPAPQYSDRYIASHPFYCYQNGTLRNLTDTTNTQYNINNKSLVVVDDITFTNKPNMCDDEEKRIKELLREGVFV